MSRVFSFRDILRVPELSHLNEVDLLNVKNDSLVNEVLAAVGFDITRPILYVPSNHRDLSNHVAVGFRAVGEINGRSEYMNTRMCPLIERLIFAAQKDPSLAKELSKMIGHSVDLSDSAIEEDTDFLEEVEEEFEVISMQLELLTALRDSIRGNPYNEQGNLKTPAEYQ